MDNNWMKYSEIKKEIEPVLTRINRRINRYKRRTSLCKDVIGENFIYGIYKDNENFIENIDYKWLTGEVKEIEEEYDRLYFSRQGIEKAINLHRKAKEYFNILIKTIYKDNNDLIETLPKTGVDILLKNNLEENKQCNHKWIYLDTNKYKKFNEIKADVSIFQTDRFYCENCCEIKEINKYI